MEPLIVEPLTEEFTPEPDAGLGALRTERGNLPLEAVDIHAKVCGLSASVTMSQGFRNPFAVPLEATYIFPLPDRASVTAMRMEAADRAVDGVLKERGEARVVYEEALAAGRRAALAEEERPDVFTMSVGNILPGERVLVRLTLSQPLPYEDGQATLRFPLVVAPRYIPGDPIEVDPAGTGVRADTDAVPDASRISPPVLLPGFPDPVRLALSVDIEPAEGLSLSEVRSSLHTVATEGHTLRLQPGERLDRDFVLRLRYAAGESFAVSDGTFTLTVVPPDDAAPRRPRDVVIVLDRSGSMHGWKMVAARRAAARIIDTLGGSGGPGDGARDRFAVLAFDHEVSRALPGDLSEASDRNRYRAIEHLARLEARGGTEMLRPLEDAVSLLSGDTSRDRIIVLVTDGQVGNEDQILGRLGLEGIRVHAVGIDRAVNAGFLGRLAALGAGRCELVESEDRLDEVMDHVHRRIAAPLVTGVALDLPSAIAGTVTPSRPADLFHGVPLVVRGRCTDPETVTVRGIAADGSPWERRLEAVERTDPAATPIWARAHLRELEDRYTAGTGDADLERRIIETSLRHGVLCRFTAFVAVDSRVVTGGSPSHRVTQPVETPSGWAPAGQADGFVGGTALPAVEKQNVPLLPGPAPAQPPCPGPMVAGAPLAKPDGTPKPGGYGAPPAGQAPAAPPPPAPSAIRGRRSVRARRADHQQPSAVPPPVTGADRGPRVTGSRTQVADELRRLRDGRPASETERRQILADLGSRLAVLLGGELAELVAALRACDDPAGPRGGALEELWERTLRELAAYAGEDAPDGEAAVGTADGPAPRTGRRFWGQRPR
jgi:Ca-activated chloride channel family protein